MGQLESFNPATGELIGSVETLTPDQVQAVVDDVAEVQPFWAQLSLADRARYLRKAADVLVEEIDEVADLLDPRAGQAPDGELHDGDRPDDRRPPLVRRHRAEDPRRRADPHGAGPFLSKKAKFSYEPHGVAA